MNLRPYQVDFVSGVARGFTDGHRKLLGVLPTGGGKTICFAKIAQRFHEKRGERTLILAHREELIDQAAAKIQMATGLIPTVEKASRHADRTSSVVVASIQTMQGARLASWPKDHFGLIVCDEAHHALANQWQTTLNHFDARVLGVTATPDRGDKRSLAKYFDHLAYEVGMMKLIDDDHLSKVAVRSVPLQIDLADVRSIGGDYDATQLDAAITPYLKQIAEFIARECGDRKRIVAFLPLIATSQRFVEECRKAGIDARHIDGKSDDRKEILADYSAGKFRLLSNAMLLTEGWDEPGVDCLLVLRPTRSRSLYAQMVGRGTRLCPGKKNLLLLDFIWMHEKHDLMKLACLVANTKEEEDAIAKALAEGDDKDLGEAISDVAAEREAALIRALSANAAKKERYIALEHVAALLKDNKMQAYSPIFGWEKAPPTEGQKRVLEKFGLKCDTKGEAVVIMNRMFDRSRAKMATIKQLQWLVRLKHPSPETATFAEAKSFLDEKWKKTEQSA